MPDLRGQMLIAMPSLLDPNFYRSVVLILRHDQAGAMGVVLNRPLTVTIKEAWEKISDVPCKTTANLFVGGPCTGPLLVLHDGRAVPDQPIIDGLHFSIEAQNIKRIIEQNIQPARFFVGSAGWSPNQLETELDSESWLTCPATETVAFTKLHQSRIWIMLTRIATMRYVAPQTPDRFFPADPQLN